MTKIDIREYNVNARWNGDNCEWSLCNYYGIKRDKRDNTPFCEGADIELDNMAISVKSSGASLASGKYFIGCKTFESMWRRYIKMDKANTWAYVTKDLQAYIMDKKEFSKFIHKFHWMGRESSNNGGYSKPMINKETKAMVEWLEKKCA